MRGCHLDPKKSRRELFQWIFALGIFWGEVSCYATTPLIVALSPGHSDITRFRPWSPIATGNHLAHEQTPLSNDTIDSVVQHREVGRAKDLSAPPGSIKVCTNFPKIQGPLKILDATVQNLVS